MGSLPVPQRGPIDHIAIIGAGPSGLAAAKYLLAEHSFSSITIFEQRSNVGGLWNYVAAQHVGQSDSTIPQTTPDAHPDVPSWHTIGGAKGANPLFNSPVYDRLETNIPRGLMRFSDLDWPNDYQLFPKHEQVLDYIERYAEGVRKLVRFGDQVLDVRLVEDGRWRVKSQLLLQSHAHTVNEHDFDAIVVANGHFNIPFIPSLAGMEDWNRMYPGSIIHSKSYRNPDQYIGKKTIVVGNSASGVDIAQQISNVCKLPLLQSQRSQSYLAPAASSTIVAKPEIEGFKPEGRVVRFKGGTEESDVDAIVYCTGYFYSYPFLKTVQPPIVNSGEYVENTYQHVFYRPQPTLAFVALNQKVIPFPLAEAQSAVIARVWSGRLVLPDEMEMKAWEQRTLQETGGGRNFHVLKFPKDADYINEMHAWVISADKDALSRSSYGKVTTSDQCRREGDAVVDKSPPYWGEKEYWTRERFPAIKGAFQSLGKERHSVRNLEDVGFDYRMWKREKEEEESRQLL